MSKKKTRRLKCDDRIDALLEDTALDDLLERVDKKHQNGGIFNDVDHHKRTQISMIALTEEELEDG